MDKISVVVPVYKAEAVLNRCIDSILSQTYVNLELILVDDGSPDHSGMICDQYAESDSRVQVIHKRNAGVAAARNSGLEIATGEYCTFVDSDDYIEPTMYQSMMDIAVRYNCDVVMCDCVKEYEDKREIYTHDIRPGYYNRSQLEKEYFPNLLMMPNVEYPPTISNGLCLYRQSQLLSANEMNQGDKKRLKNTCYKLRYEEGIRFSEDLLFGAELLYHANSFYYMKGQCFYHYWMNPQSVTHTFASDKWSDYIRLYKKIQEKFAECEEYDFKNQIDLVLLFFVYNAVGDVLTTDSIGKKKKKKIIYEILNTNDVNKMFSRVKIRTLKVSIKLKILTFMYKYKIGIDVLINKKK